MPPIGVSGFGYPPYTYHWTTNSETYVIEDSTIYNPIFSFLGDVTVYLKVTDACSCIPAYDTLTLSMHGVGMLDYGLSDIITIFPNPTKDILNIEIRENIKIQSIVIYCMDGKLIENNMYSFQSGQLNVSRLQTGTYVINIETEKGNFNQIIIKN